MDIATHAHPQPQPHSHPGALSDIAAMAGATAAGTPAPATRPAVQLTIATPALTPGWRDEVTRELTQLVVLRHDRAEIRLNPADLGPITVQIRMDAGQANLLIQAPQPATRDGLELALPQLRESLAERGITLGQANVRDERAPQDGAPERQAFAARTAGASDDASVAPLTLRARLGLVDLFA